MAVGIRVKRSGITQEQFDEGHDHIESRSHAAEGTTFSRIWAGRWRLGDHWLLGIPRGLRCLRVRIAEGLSAAGVKSYRGHPTWKSFPSTRWSTP